jgi:hypothetical protein
LLRSRVLVATGCKYGNISVEAGFDLLFCERVTQGMQLLNYVKEAELASYIP